MENNFMQIGDTVACGHCQPQNYAKAEPCVCNCHSKAPTCDECQFEESHSQQCSKYVGFEVSEKCNNPERCNHKVCHPVKAPTGESWENLKKLVRKAISNGVNEYEKWHEPLAHKSSVEKRIAGFLFQSIASQLQKEREKAYADGYADGAQIHQNSFEAGKSEAFSLVRYAIAKLKSRKTNALQESYEQHVLDNLLSTLEGK